MKSKPFHSTVLHAKSQRPYSHGNSCGTFLVSNRSCFLGFCVRSEAEGQGKIGGCIDCSLTVFDINKLSFGSNSGLIRWLKVQSLNFHKFGIRIFRPISIGRFFWPYCRFDFGPYNFRSSWELMYGGCIPTTREACWGMTCTTVYATVEILVTRPETIS